ncbi:hypothetical protein TNCV_1840021 [Trichonephila clavipes]|nr:hypothetical protein TNCV_1840021 [Trichonephila clavipes]
MMIQRSLTNIILEYSLPNESRFSPNTNSTGSHLDRTGILYHPSNIMEVDHCRGSGVMIYAGVSTQSYIAAHLSGKHLTALRYRNKMLEPLGFSEGTATAGSDVVQSGRLIFDDFFQHLWPYIGNNTANVVFQMVKRLWLIRIDQ